MFELFIYLVLFVAICAVILGFFLWREIGASPKESELEKFNNLSYFKAGAFQSPKPLITDFKQLPGGSFPWIKFLFGRSDAPNSMLPMRRLFRSDFSTPSDDLSFYWLGHSSVILELSGLRVIFDPVFGNAAPIPFALRRYAPPPLPRSELPKLDIVIITHNHYDHLERATLGTISARHFIVPLGLKRTLVKWGVEDDKITELGWGDETEISGLKIIATTGIHYSKRGPFDYGKTLWNSYVVMNAKRRVFVSGDSGYGEHFRQIGEKYGPFDLAALEIDGWNKAWPNTHMHPNEALQAGDDLRAAAILPIHWGAYDLAMHPWNESIEIMSKNAGSTKLLTPLMGEKTTLDSATDKWWKSVK